MESLNELRKQVELGNLEIASMGSDNNHQKIPFSELEKKVDSTNRLNRLSQELQKLSWQERYEWVNIHKLKGNKVYADGKFQQAINIYMESLVGLDLRDPQRLKTVREELQYPILLNIATCYYRLQLWEKGVLITDKVLELDNSHCKALFKKGCLLSRWGSTQKARQCLNSAMKVANEEMRQPIMSELRKLQASCKEEEQLYRRMFDNNEDQRLIQGESDPEDVLEYRPKGFLWSILDCVKSALTRKSRKIE